MDVPGTENSETEPTNWLWVKAGLLSFWSSTTISMVVGFSSLSPLGDSAKAFSYTHTNTDTTDKCFLIKTAFMKSLFLIFNDHKSHTFHGTSNRPLKVSVGIRGICTTTYAGNGRKKCGGSLVQHHGLHHSHLVWSVLKSLPRCP